MKDINDIQTYLKQVGEYPLLTEDEEKKLFLKYKETKDEKIREELVNRNLKLVISIAKKYKGTKLNFMDLVQEGNFGLMAAIDKYNVELGYKFSTYATYWIRQAISKALVDKNKIVRLPAHIVNKISKMRQTEMQLATELNRTPSIEEIANRMQVLPQEVMDLKDINLEALSLDIPVGQDEDGTLGDFIEDYKTKSPSKEAEKLDLKEQLLSVMDSLDPREKEVLIKRYGLITEEPLTLEETGAAMGLSRERIRQIEEKALRKMRNPIRSNQLKIYIAEMAA
jgi:RNA polymerase primary sigma factor